MLHDLGRGDGLFLANLTFVIIVVPVIPAVFVNVKRGKNPFKNPQKWGSFYL